LDNKEVNVNRSALRIVLLAALGVALVIGAVTIPRASAYVLANGCDEYDPARNKTYVCTPSRSDFYTPDGVDPAAVPVGTNYGSDVSSRTGPQDVYCCDGGAIPPPAPYRAGRDYCSNPWYGNSAYESRWQYTCYRHDVCYGSQLGRKHCDSQFWRNMIADCKAFSWYNPDRYACFADAAVWYAAVRWSGASHYKPRTSSTQPAGE
jgi:hypothetical protein